MCSTLTGFDCAAVDKLARLIIEHVGSPVETNIAEFLVGSLNDDIIGRPTLAEHNVVLGYPGFLICRLGSRLLLKRF